MFADQAKIYIRSGKGGDGHVSFRRELYVPNGGPDGGDGGRGGDLIFEVDPGINTLNEFRHIRKYCAEDGEPGGKRRCHGKDGADLVVKVPAGTIVKEANSGQVITDMSYDNTREVILKGGRGGKGNQHYATPTMQVPKYAQPGKPATELEVILELKTIADVGLVGFPNVGKSTLMNCLIGQKIAITSSKPQTTRNRIQTVYTSQEGQIVFVDTPGIHKAKNKLGDYMVNIATRSLRDVDVVLWLVEPTNYIGAGEKHIIEQLKGIKTPVILVINKIDTVKKEELFGFIDTYRKEMDFQEIVPVSALKQENTEELIKCIMKYLPYGPAFYDEDTITDQPQRQIVAELIREKALRCLDEEIPHGIAVTIEKMKWRKSSKGTIVDIEATIICERESHKGIIIGKQGTMLRKIGQSARRDIEEMLEEKVNLQLWVKVRRDWRDSDLLLKNYGYNPKDNE